VKLGADLVGARSLNGVALSAASLDTLLENANGFPYTIPAYLEELGTLGRVTWKDENVSRLFRLLRGLNFGFAHVDRSKKAESVKAGHVALVLYIIDVIDNWCTLYQIKYCCGKRKSQVVVCCQDMEFMAWATEFRN
jgi:hypothetical protein